MIKLPSGLWPVMLNTFTEDFKIDLFGLEQLTDFYINKGANGLFANCLSSEMYQLSEEERLTITKSVVKFTNGKITVIATGTFYESLEKNIDFIKKIYDCGVNAVIINNNQLAEEGSDESLYKNKIEKIINGTGNIPLGIYECPVPYKKLISPELMKWLANSERFIYHKDTSCDLSNIENKLNAIKNTNLGLYNANTPTALKSLIKGAQGISPIGANYFPELFSYLVNNYQNPDIEKEIKKINALLSILDPVVHSFYPFSAKLFLQKRGLKINTVTRTEIQNLESQDYIKLNDMMYLFEDIANQLKINTKL